MKQAYIIMIDLVVIIISAIVMIITLLSALFLLSPVGAHRENSSELRMEANLYQTPATHEANASLLVMPNQPELEGSQPQPRSSSRGTGRTRSFPGSCT